MDVVLPGRPDGGAVAVEKARVKPSIWIASGDSTTRDLLENQLRQRYACDYESMPLPIGCSPFAITTGRDLTVRCNFNHRSEKSSREHRLPLTQGVSARSTWRVAARIL